MDVHATTTPHAASAADGAVVVPLSPARILDTRSGNGAPAAAVAPGQTITLQVTGRGGVPANATCVVLNLTINGAEGAGFVSAYPTGSGTLDTQTVTINGIGAVSSVVTVSLPSGGTVFVSCTANGGTDPSVHDRLQTAIQIDSLTQQ